MKEIRKSRKSEKIRNQKKQEIKKKQEIEKSWKTKKKVGNKKKKAIRKSRKLEKEIFLNQLTKGSTTTKIKITQVMVGTSGLVCYSKTFFLNLRNRT